MANQKQTDNNFHILFQMLENTIQEQHLENVNFNNDSEMNDTILLFKEFQESIIRDSFTTFTRG